MRSSSLQIHVNTRASKNADGVYSTADGRSFDAEIVYMTVGGKPNTEFLKGGLVPLNAKGFIEVSWACIHLLCKSFPRDWNPRFLPICSLPSSLTIVFKIGGLGPPANVFVFDIC